MDIKFIFTSEGEDHIKKKSLYKIQNCLYMAVFCSSRRSATELAELCGSFV